jgi:MFS family permease
VTWLSVVELTVDVRDPTHSGAWVSGLLMADFLPAIAIGLLLGSVVDRFSRRRLMIGADLVRFAVFCALPFTDSVAAIVALAAVAGFATGFFRPAVRAGLPNLVADEDLAAANSLVQSAESVTNALGPLLGGAIVAASGPGAAYWINAATFLLSAAVLMRVPDRLLQSETPLSRGHWRDLADGFALIGRSRALLTVMVAWSLVMVSNAGVNVAEVALAKDTFNAGTFGFGLLSAGFGVGIAVGSLFSARLIERSSVASVYGAAIALMAVGIGAAAASPNVWVATVCVVVCGLGNGAAVVANALLVQRGAPDHLRGRAFTVVMSTNFAVLGLGMLAAGPLTDAFGARWVWAGSALAAAIGAVVGYGLAQGIDSAELRPSPERLVAPTDPMPATQETEPAL